MVSKALGLAVFVVSLSVGSLEAANNLSIEDTTANVGDTGVLVPIKLDSDQALYGFQLSIEVEDPSLVIITGMSVAGTVSSPAGDPPEFSAFEVRAEGAKISYGLVREVDQDPFDPADTIAAGSNLHIANLVLDVVATEAASAAITFKDVAGSSPLEKNVLVDTAGSSIAPDSKTDGTLTIQVGGTPTFIRGDANDDGDVDLSDAVTILGDLFLGTPADAPCLDALDADDTGEVEITDAIYLLDALFTGGDDPPPPFPDPGIDPTLDPLGC